MKSQKSVMVASLVASLAAAACDVPPPEPGPDKSAPPQKAAAAQTSTAAHQQTPPPKAEPPVPPPKKKVVGHPPVAVKPSPDDPLKGVFTLADATKGLPPGKEILASIETSMGTLECKLWDDKAPITVANFVGLARGVRPWKTPEGKWEKKPAYDGTIFHRIVKGFMIQGGDAKKNGTGEPGYVIPDEVWDDASHDKAGLICMANRGPNTNGAQFFITDAATPFLDNGYTIFGECGPEELIHKLASVEVTGEKPKTPPDIKKITIKRK